MPQRKSQTCSRCLNDQTVRNVNFDADGVCNFCHQYDQIAPQLNDYDTLSKLFRERVDAVKGKHAYDVAVGISGGKDGIFVLYQLIHQYHLKVCTFTLDNGFFSPDARRNVNRIMQGFQVEHEYIEFDREFLADIYHYSMTHFLTPCVACSYLGYVAMINYAMRRDAGFCIHGRSPEQMLRCYGNDVFTNFVNLGLKSINDINIDAEYCKILDDVAQKLNPKIAQQVRTMLYRDAESAKLREFVPYFLYHPYDEAKIIDFLQSHTQWRPPTDYNHYDCKVHNAAKYIYQTAEGRPHRLPETSVRVRRGEISQKEGQDILQQEIIDKPQAELDYLCHFARVNQTLLLLKAKTYHWINQHHA